MWNWGNAMGRLRSISLILAGVSLAALADRPAVASQLVYTPINPSFGGNPFNGPYILGQASANNYKFLQNKSAQSQQSGPNAAQQFQQQITSALLSQVATQVSQQILGTNANKSGTFNFNGEIVQFNRAGGQVNIAITDAATGGTTTIQIPAPAF